jgi:hypothetical protein
MEESEAAQADPAAPTPPDVVVVREPRSEVVGPVTEAAELASLFEGLAAAFRARGAVAPAATVAEEPAPPASEAVESVEAREAFPDVDPHVVGLAKVKRAYTKKVKP